MSKRQKTAIAAVSPPRSSTGLNVLMLLESATDCCSTWVAGDPVEFVLADVEALAEGDSLGGRVLLGRPTGAAACEVV